MKVFFDNNLSPRLAQAIHILVEPRGHQVTHLRAKFDAATPDHLWLEALGKERDWVVISADMRIYKNRAERQAWRNSRTIAFFLTPWWSKQSNEIKASKLLARWDDIETQARIVAAPAAYELGPSGRMKQLRN